MGGIKMAELGRIDLKGGGFVELIEVSANIEKTITRAARVSYGNDEKETTKAQDDGLINFLISEKHTSPLEMGNVTFHLKIPLSICTQILRHRTAKVNCVSHRYTKANEGHYVPVTCVDDIRFQSDLNKQSSHSIQGHQNAEEALLLFEELEKNAQSNFKMYERLLELGVAREQARFYLCCAEFTRCVWQMDINNYLKFLTLRMAPDAQLEIREVAEAMYTLTENCIPGIMESYRKHTLDSVTFNSDEIGAIAEANGNLSKANALKIGNKRQQEAFKRKLEKFA